MTNVYRNVECGVLQGSLPLELQRLISNGEDRDGQVGSLVVHRWYFNQMRLVVGDFLCQHGLTLDLNAGLHCLLDIDCMLKRFNFIIYTLSMRLLFISFYKVSLFMQLLALLKAFSRQHTMVQITISNTGYAHVKV